MDEDGQRARGEGLREAVRRRRPPGRDEGEGGVHEVVVADLVEVPREPLALVLVPRQQLLTKFVVFGGAKLML